MHKLLPLLLGSFCTLVAPRPLSAKPHLAPAPSMSAYVTSHGFKPSSNPGANLSALSPIAHAQLELFLLEGAEAGAKTGDPVLLAWFAVADASLASWRLTNCGDYNFDIDYDCDVMPWGGNIWQVGLGVQVTDHYAGVAAAFAWAHPGRSAKEVGDEVFALAAQKKSFPASVTVASLAANPGGITQGMHNSYWISALQRDLRVSAYLESPPATTWPCYRAGYPGWCAWYRQPSKWQEYSDVLSMVIRSWDQIQGKWKAAKTPDVIVDDASKGFSTSAATSADGKNGWRGRYAWAPAAPSPNLVGTWTAKLPVAGKWTVSAFVPYGNHATVSAAKYVVHANDGQHELSLDQSQVGGSFHDLGSFEFGTTAKVTLGNQGSSGQYVGFDALRFHWLAAATKPPVDGGGGVGSGGAGSGGAGSSGAGSGGVDGGAGGSAGAGAESALGGAAGSAGEANAAGAAGAAGSGGTGAAMAGGKAGGTTPADDAIGCATSRGSRGPDFWFACLAVSWIARRRASR